MALTKEQAAEFIIDNLEGGDRSDDSKFDRRDLFIFIDMALAYLIEKNYFISRTDGNYDIDGSFITTYRYRAIQHDEGRDEFFTDLPAVLVNVRDNRGLREVRPMKNPRTAFPILSASQQSMFGSLEAGDLAGNIGVYVEGTKIFYTKDPRPVEKVLIKMISSVEDLREDERLPVPASMEMELLQLAIQFMSGKKQTPEDNLNDSVDE